MYTSKCTNKAYMTLHKLHTLYMCPCNKLYSTTASYLMSSLAGHATANRLIYILAEAVMYVLYVSLIKYSYWEACHSCNTRIILLPVASQFPCIGMHAFIALSSFKKFFKCEVYKTEHMWCMYHTWLYAKYAISLPNFILKMPSYMIQIMHRDRMQEYI